MLYGRQAISHGDAAKFLGGTRQFAAVGDITKCDDVTAALLTFYGSVKEEINAPWDSGAPFLSTEQLGWRTSPQQDASVWRTRGTTTDRHAWSAQTNPSEWGASSVCPLTLFFFDSECYE